MAWFIAVLCAALAAWALLRYYDARRDAETFRAEARRRMDELASLGYNENKVGRRVEAVGEATLDAVLVCKADHTVIYLNPAAEALFGKPVATNRSLIAVTRQYEIEKLADEALADSPEGRDGLDRHILIDGQTFRARAATYAGGVVIALINLPER